MNLVNVAIENLGAKIKTYSSSIDSSQQPNNILHPSQYSLWTTGQGIPQFVIVSLQDLIVNFKNIKQIGFMLWHDYDTNPKQIELWVAQTTQQQFVFWSKFQLQQKKGIQLYQIQPLSSKYIYLKISITQTYGGFQTYLNQVFFMAQHVTQLRKQYKQKTQKDIVMKDKKKQLDIEDLQSNLNQLVQIDRKISRSKSKSNKNKQQQNKLNRRSREIVIPRNQKHLSKQNDRIQQRQEISKASLSSNRGGRSIYYRSDQHLIQDDSHEYVSNDYQPNEYQSSSSNANNKLPNKHVDQKVSSQESQQYSRSLQSNNTIMSPSLNINSESNSYSKSGHNKFSRTKKQSTNQIQQNRQRQNRKLRQIKNKNRSQQNQDEQQNINDDESNIQQQDQQGQNIDQDEEFSNELIKNTPKYKQINEQVQNQSQQQSQQNQQINNYNVAILALSKHVVRLQDNMQNIQRKVQVLDLRVTHSHQKIQQQLFQKVQNKVQQIVDRKLQKMWSLKHLHKQRNDDRSGKNRHKRIQQQEYIQKPSFKQIDNQPLNYKKNLTKQFFKSQYYDQQQNLAQMRDKTKTKRRSKQKYDQDYKRQNKQKLQYYKRRQDEQNQPRQMMNRLKTSKSFTNITNKYNNTKPTQMTKSRNKQQRGPNQQYIADLLQKLNAKLKQRSVKLNRIHNKQKQKYQQKQNINKRIKYGLKQRNYQHRNINHNNQYY